MVKSKDRSDERGARAPVAPKAAMKLRAFDYQDVSLGPSMFLTQVEGARAVYGGIDDDDILKGFRMQAGLPAPGNGMKGWCETTSSVIFGQLISGMVRLGRATSDGALTEKAIRLYAGWRETIPDDGNARMRPYDWDKLVCGLVDLNLYAGEDTSATLHRTVAWAARTFDRSRRPADAHDFWGAGPGDTSEWYTLPENLYRGYLATGDSSLREFADVWLYEDYWGPFADSAQPGAVLPVHAYSHVNSFSSAAAAHLVTGDPRYLQICINGYDFLQRTQCYATGGYGPDERLMPPDGSLGRSLDVCGYHAEVPCGSWAAFKLSKYLMCFTGEARFGDWIETTLYNAMGASLPPEPDGRSYYYGEYAIGYGTKGRYWHEWPCCSGTYIQNVADYHDLIFLHDDEGIAINLFVPAECTWRAGDQTVRLRQTTDYPESETTTVRVETEKPAHFRLRFRVPGWSAAADFRLNGTALAVDARPGQWATIEREWQPGDEITMRVPMSLRAVPVDPQHPQRAAIMYGPVVLAQDEACCRRPFAINQSSDLNGRLHREGSELKFRIINTMPERHTRYLEPFYCVPASWPYWVYFDLDAKPLY